MDRAEPRRKRLARAAVWAGGVSALVVLVALVRVSPYRPGLGPDPGYEMRNATQPDGFIAGYLKSGQAYLEVRPCEYEILGWGADGGLYYRATCRGQAQLWRADPTGPSGSRRVAAVPHGLAAERLPRTTVLHRVRAPGVLPVTAEPWVREVNLRSPGYPSPDGVWLAFVAERAYGPQDVLLLREER